MQRDGIVDLAADLTRAEEFAEFVAAVSADDILMKNMVSVSRCLGRPQRGVS